MYVGVAGHNISLQRVHQVAVISRAVESLLISIRIFLPLKEKKRRDTIFMKTIVLTRFLAPNSSVHWTTNQQLRSHLILFGLCASGTVPVWFLVGLAAASWPRPFVLQTRGLLPLLLRRAVGALHWDHIPADTRIQP